MRMTRGVVRRIAKMSRSSDLLLREEFKLTICREDDEEDELMAEYEKITREKAEQRAKEVFNRTDTDMKSFLISFTGSRKGC